VYIGSGSQEARWLRDDTRSPGRTYTCRSPVIEWMHPPVRYSITKGGLFQPARRRPFCQCFGPRDVGGQRWQKRIIWVPPCNCSMQYDLALLQFQRTPVSSDAWELSKIVNDLCKLLRASTCYHCQFVRRLFSSFTKEEGFFYAFRRV
jgi:hypothetical protein